MKRDLETILDNIETMLKAKYNTQLTVIDAEKADGITLSPIGTDAYAMQTLNNVVANYNPFIFYGVEKIDTLEAIGPATATRYAIDVVVVVSDDGNDPDIARKMFRYGRAFQEVFEENFSSISQGDTFTIETLEPVIFKLVNSSQNYRSVGVKVNISSVL